MPIKAADLSEPFEDILYVKRDHIAFITLNRPALGNSITLGMHERIRAIWEDVKRDPDVRVAVVTGAGDRHFCTGADVGGLGAGTTALGHGYAPMTEELYWSPRYCNVWKPVISAINGLVVGGGLHFVVDADIVVAADTAQFMDSHVGIGQVGAVENIGLAKRLPIGTALRMTLTGRSYRLPAQRAYQLGLVDELVAPNDLAGTAESIAREITKNSPDATSLSKQAIWGSLEMSYQQAMEYGWALLRMHWSHPDSSEGPRAFLDKRAPVWTTR